MAQGDYIELFQKRYGRRLDHYERKRKREARMVKRNSRMAQHLRGIKAKLYNKKRYSEKVLMKKT